MVSDLSTVYIILNLDPSWLGESGFVISDGRSGRRYVRDRWFCTPVNVLINYISDNIEEYNFTTNLSYKTTFYVILNTSSSNIKNIQTCNEHNNAIWFVKKKNAKIID